MDFISFAHFAGVPPTEGAQKEVVEVEALRRQLRDALDSREPEKRAIAVYGAGNTSELYAPSFQAEKIEPAYFIDNNPDKQGKLFQGKPVIPFAQAHELCRGDLILVCGGTRAAREGMLRSLEADPIEDAAVETVDEYVFRRNAEKVLAVFDQLDDELSRETYVNMVLTRMHKQPQRPELTMPNAYFGVPAFALRSGREVFVDCGAFVGDSIEQYLWMRSGEFGRIYAFEPNSSNYAAMRARAQRLRREWALEDERIVLVQAGVGATEANASFRTDDAGGGSLSAGLDFAAGGVSR